MSFNKLTTNQQSSQIYQNKMSYSSEKVCLKWNDFQDNIAISFQELRKDNEYSDVTLVSEEDQQIQAHKIILSACSPFFSSVLKRNKHSHPLIYMRGLKTKDLLAMVDFIYHGEANVFQEDLEEFLALAEELQLKGLAKYENPTLDEKQETSSKLHVKTHTKEIILKQEHSNHDPVEIEDENPSIPMHVGTPLITVNPSIEDVKLKIDSLLERDIDGVYRCTACGKTNKGVAAKNNMKQHIETHFEGISHPCKQCGKVTRSRNSL